MADIADLADEYTSKRLADQIEIARSTQGTVLKPIGMCHNCREEVPHIKIFCDGDCAKEYDRRKQ